MTQSCCSQVRGCYLVKPTEFGSSLLILKRDLLKIILTKTRRCGKITSVRDTEAGQPVRQVIWPCRTGWQNSLYATVAQSVEQLIRNQQVVCSSHISSSTPERIFCSGVFMPTPGNGTLGTVQDRSLLQINLYCVFRMPPG